MSTARPAPTATSRPDLLLLLMRASSGVAERVNAAVVAAGHPHLRPRHGLVFVRASGAGATVSEIAAFLGIRKQSAAATVDQLVALGYLTREAHPEDGRAQLLRLTPAAVEVTHLATQASIAEWQGLDATQEAGLGPGLARALEHLGRDAGPRPVW